MQQGATPWGQQGLEEKQIHPLKQFEHFMRKEGQIHNEKRVLLGPLLCTKAMRSPGKPKTDKTTRSKFVPFQPKRFSYLTTAVIVFTIQLSIVTCEYNQTAFIFRKRYLSTVQQVLKENIMYNSLYNRDGSAGGNKIGKCGVNG